MTPVLCLDVGSTFTKAMLVAPDGSILGTAEHPTTAESDVMVGIRATRVALGVPAGEAVACSSAGGGLRLAVVGYQRRISAEAGQRVALSAGARVVLVYAGAMDDAAVRELVTAHPDVVLLVGGTDGGEAGVLLHNAARLARSRVRAPVVLAGNAEAAAEAGASLRARGRRLEVTANVLPDIGVINPGPARAAIRRMFLEHVIGGKGLSRGPAFARLVRAVTPDAVLDGVALLGAVQRERDPGARAVVVVDVGGATTDVYSALAPQVGRAAVQALWDRRTVEGDLGMRWSAPALLAAARTEGLLPGDADRGDGPPAGAAGVTSSGAGPAAGSAGATAGATGVTAGATGVTLDSAGLAAAARRRAADVGYIPDSPAEAHVDATLGALAAIIALRRHVRAEAAYEQGSVSAEGAALVVLSGGVFRHLDADALAAMVARIGADRGGARAVLDRARIVVDDRYVLAPAGLLAATRPAAARSLVSALLDRSRAVPTPG